MGHKELHRGFPGDIGSFARAFVTTRLGGFQKDIAICLTDTPNEQGGTTHAYFPALAACCAFLEYMTGLCRGKIDNVSTRDIADWAESYLPQPDYSKGTIRILVEAFRNSVAHRGIATGIWSDRSDNGREARRITWMLSESRHKPSCHLVEEVSALVKDPPWPCPYTHRMHIYLRGLADDLCAGAESYANAVAAEVRLQEAFESAMKQLYPMPLPAGNQRSARTT